MGVIQKVQDVLHPKSGGFQKSGAIAAPPAPKPRVYDENKVAVVFVLGGPGAGKGTQCANLVRDYAFVHLSAGDLLRVEQHREGSQYGELIKENIREGKIVPSEVTIKLLQNAIRSSLESPQADSANPNTGESQGRFLIDGFPRQMDQALSFDAEICLSSFVLFFTCTEEVMLQRLLERGKTSGREDDNTESIKKRFRTFVETSMPVVDYYKTKNKVVEIDSTQSAEEVYAEVKKAVEAKLTG